MDYIDDGTGTVYVSLPDFADNIGLERSSVRKVLIGKGVPMQKRRGPSGQMTLYVDKERALAAYDSEWRPLKPDSPDAGGVFYMVAVMPEDAPQNIVTGHTTDLARRLGEYRMSWYQAKVVKTWTARKHWEKLIQDAIESVDGTDRHGEQFTIRNIDSVIEHVESLMKMLPTK